MGLDDDEPGAPPGFLLDRDEDTPPSFCIEEQDLLKFDEPDGINARDAFLARGGGEED